MLVHPSQDDSQCFASSHLTHGHLEFKGLHYNNSEIQIKMVCIEQQHMLNKFFLIKMFSLTGLFSTQIGYLLYGTLFYYQTPNFSYAICLSHNLILL